MNDRFRTENPELDALFERYRAAPESHVFAPLADACRKAGMVEEALEICEKGVRNNPGYTSGHVVRGKCHFDMGNIETAEKSFERVLQLDPNNLVALKYLGMICAEAGQAEQAREHFKHILALDPDNKEIKAKLDSLADVEDIAEESPKETEKSLATVEPREAVELRDVDADESFEGAPITLGADDEDDGEDRSDELATLTLADIYAAQGYTDKALRIYRDVLSRQPNNARAAERIRELGGKIRGDGADPESEVNGREPVPEQYFEDVAPPEAGGEPVISVEAMEADEDGDAVSSPRRTLAAARTAGEPEDVLGDDDSEGPGGPPTMDDERSYEQFKRWLKNLSD